MIVTLRHFQSINIQRILNKLISFMDPRERLDPNLEISLSSPDIHRMLVHVRLFHLANQPNFHYHSDGYQFSEHSIGHCFLTFLFKRVSKQLKFLISLIVNKFFEMFYDVSITVYNFYNYNIVISNVTKNYAIFYNIFCTLSYSNNNL